MNRVMNITVPYNGETVGFSNKILFVPTVCLVHSEVETTGHMEALEYFECTTRPNSENHVYTSDACQEKLRT